MTLHFPNQSRSFDEAKGCIRFIGHDDVFEVVFRLDIDALIKIDANLVQNEQGYIAVFDLARIRDRTRCSKSLYSQERPGCIVNGFRHSLKSTDVPLVEETNGSKERSNEKY